MNPTGPSNINQNYMRHWKRNNEGNVPYIPPPRPAACPYRYGLSTIVPNSGSGPFVKPRWPELTTHFYSNTTRPPPEVEFTRDTPQPAPIWMQRGYDWGTGMSRSDIERHIHKQHMERLSKDRKMNTARAVPSGKLPMEFGLERVSKENTAALGRRDIHVNQSRSMPALSGGMPYNFNRVVDEAPITANAAQFVPAYKGEVFVPVSGKAQGRR